MTAVKVIILDGKDMPPVRVDDYEIPPAVGDTLWHPGYRQALEVTDRHWVTPDAVLLHLRPVKASWMQGERPELPVLVPEDYPDDYDPFYNGPRI